MRVSQYFDNLLAGDHKTDADKLKERFEEDLTFEYNLPPEVQAPARQPRCQAPHSVNAVDEYVTVSRARWKRYKTRYTITQTAFH